MRFHTVVAVVGAQLQKFGQILVPGVEINRDRTLTHSELVDRDSGVVDEPNPAYYAACRALKSAYGRARRAHLAEIKPHSTAEFADFREIVYAAVNAVQRVWNGVDETAGKLMVRLAGIGQRRRRDGDFQKRKHIVKLAHPLHFVLFVHRKMHCDAEEHLLRRFEQRTVEIVDYVSFQHELQRRISEKVVAAAVYDGRALRDFLPRVMFEDVRPVKFPFGKIGKFCVKSFDVTRFELCGELLIHIEHHKPRGDELPLGGFLRGEFHRGAHQRRVFCTFVRTFPRERGKFAAEMHQVVFGFGIIVLYPFQHSDEHGVVETRSNLVAVRSRFCTCVAVEDETLDLVKIALFHKGFFRKVLHLFDRDGK